jgi:putative transposase
METTPSPSLSKGHRFPPEIISHCVWLYSRFSLSYRDIEEIMAERGVKLTYEPVRKWCLKFGQRYANALHRCHPQPGDKWYLDEVFLTIHGQVHSVWRAVDQHGTVLKVLMQRQRDKKAAQKFFRKLLKDWQDVPRAIIPDKLASYQAAKREILPGVEHRQHKGREYSCRELTPADPATGADHARVQIARTSPAVSCGV